MVGSYRGVLIGVRDFKWGQDGCELSRWEREVVLSVCFNLNEAGGETDFQSDGSNFGPEPAKVTHLVYPRSQKCTQKPLGSLDVELYKRQAQMFFLRCVLVCREEVENGLRVKKRCAVDEGVPISPGSICLTAFQQHTRTTCCSIWAHTSSTMSSHFHRLPRSLHGMSSGAHRSDTHILCNRSMAGCGTGSPDATLLAVGSVDRMGDSRRWPRGGVESSVSPKRREKGEAAEGSARAEGDWECETKTGSVASSRPMVEERAPTASSSSDSE